MKSTLDPSELSEVYFLIDALVGAPQAAEEVGRLTAESATKRVREAARVLVDAFMALQAGGGQLNDDWESTIVETVRKRDPAVAEALSWSLANRPARRPVRRVAG